MEATLSTSSSSPSFLSLCPRAETPKFELRACERKSSCYYGGGGGVLSTFSAPFPMH